MPGIVNNEPQIKSLEFMPYEVLLDTLVDTQGLGETFIDNNPNYAKVAPILGDLKLLIDYGGLNNHQISRVLKSFSYIINSALEMIGGGTTMLTLATTLKENPIFKKTFIGFLKDSIRDEVGKYRLSLENSPSTSEIRPTFNTKGDVSEWSVVVNGVEYNILALFFINPVNIVEARQYCRQPDTKLPRIATA